MTYSIASEIKSEEALNKIEQASGKLTEIIPGFSGRNFKLDQGCPTRFSSGATSSIFNLKRAGPM